MLSSSRRLRDVELRARARRRRSRGVSLVEFALVAPTGFLLLLGAVILALVVSSQIAITNGARDVARTAAICGSDTGSSSTTSLPNGGGVCTTTNVDTFIKSHLSLITSCASTCGSVQLSVVDAKGVTVAGAVSGYGSSTLASCATSGSSGYTYPYYVQVKATYYQQLYIPGILTVFESGSGPGGTRELDAVSEAPCEQ